MSSSNDDGVVKKSAKKYVTIYFVNWQSTADFTLRVCVCSCVCVCEGIYIAEQNEQKIQTHKMQFGKFSYPVNW